MTWPRECHTLWVGFDLENSGLVFYHTYGVSGIGKGVIASLGGSRVHENVATFCSTMAMTMIKWRIEVHFCSPLFRVSFIVLVICLPEGR